MRKTLLLFCLLCIAAVQMKAQYNLKQNNVWAMGYHAGLDFSSGTPVPVTTAMDIQEIGASVSDTAGHLLFYTNGDTVWNKNHQPMPNGRKITATSSITAGACIVPFVHDATKYYVFSVELRTFFDPNSARLYYSVVDMIQNGGLGDVTTRGVIIDSLFATKIVPVAGDSCDIWLVGHVADTAKFKSYRITEAGINMTPVISIAGTLDGILSYSEGQMTVSPNRKKLAVGSVAGLPQGLGVEVFDFDPAKGIVSNTITLDTFVRYFGVEFSPDNTKLYATSQNDPTADYPNLLVQYDLTQGTPAAVKQSRVVIDTLSTISSYFSPIKLGPDGKIYTIGGSGVYTSPSGFSGADSIFRIENPNATGIACQLTRKFLKYNAGTGSPYGFPNGYAVTVTNQLSRMVDTTLPAGAITANLSVPSGFDHYTWGDGSTDSVLTVTDTGTYWVNYGNECYNHNDTFVVHKTLAVITAINGNVAMKIYPNPASNKVTIQVPGNTGKLQLVDAIGRIVMTQPCNNNLQQLNTTQLPAGLYEVCYISGDMTMLRTKLLITR